MFALAVALGCDLFDSAAYTLYAKDKRYMTETGTSRLNELEYFPCACPRCSRKTPKEVLELPHEEAQTWLAEHNLYVCASELKRIKQAIKDGRLWEHLQMRAHGHPALLQAVKRLGKYQDFIEKHDTAVKNSGLFFFNSVGLMRPEVVRHVRKLTEAYIPPRKTRILLLAPQTRTKPFHKSKSFANLSSMLQRRFKRKSKRIHACFYGAPFGIVPIELDEVYPLSQHETVLPLDKETVEYVKNQVVNYINRTDYEMVILFNETENWGQVILNACRKACLEKNIKLEWIKTKVKQNETLLA